MLVRYILSSVCLRFSQFSQLSFLSYMWLCVLSLPVTLDDCENMCTLSYHHHQIRTMTHCLCLASGHETMAWTLCLFIFFMTSCYRKLCAYHCWPFAGHCWGESLDQRSCVTRVSCRFSTWKTPLLSLFTRRPGRSSAVMKRTFFGSSSSGYLPLWPSKSKPLNTALFRGTKPGVVAGERWSLCIGVNVGRSRMVLHKDIAKLGLHTIHRRDS